VGLTDGLEIVATRRLGNAEEARDAAQETIARLLERVNAGLVASEAELAPIAWGIARHVIADMLRERSRVAELPAELPGPGKGPLDALVSADEAARVRRALARLVPGDRALLCRCFVDGERIGAIAEALGEPAERVRKRKSRALQRLAALLGAERTEDGHDSRASAMERQ
jgi:RNA polymerase sigma factor (sigma-70 family)